MTNIIYCHFFPLVKSGAEAPYFDPAELARASGTTPSPGPFPGSNAHTPTKGHVSPSVGPVGGDGFISAAEEHESGAGGAAGSSVNGMMASPCGAQSISTSTTPTNMHVGGSQDVNNNNNPIQALQQSGSAQEPTLEALIHALPPNWTDAKLKVHSGAVELSSLSSRHPAEIMYDIKMVVLRLGIEIRSDSDFKIKCVRRKRKSLGASAAPGSNGASAGANGAGSGSVNGGGGQGGITSLSVKSLLQGHGLHYHHNNNTKGGPDDAASVMSSNLSIDREAWVSARSVLGGAGAGAVQGPGSVIGTGTSVSGKKKNGIRTMLWRNSTSASLASASSPTPSPTSPTSGNSAISTGGGTAMVTQGSGLPTRQLSQVMNGSGLGLVASPQPQPHFVGGGSGGSGFVITAAAGNGHEHGLVESVATDHDSSAVPPSSVVAGGDDARNLGAGSVVGISSSTTSTTIGAVAMSQSTTVVPPLQQLQLLQQQQAMLAATPTSTSVDGMTPNGDNSANVVTAMEPLYGEEAIDSGEEIRFSIELCRMKNLRGLYSVDIRRVKGNRWAYKFLYHAILNTLDLQGKGGYLAGGLVPAQMAGLAGGSGVGSTGGVSGSVAAPNVAMSVR